MRRAKFVTMQDANIPMLSADRPYFGVVFPVVISTFVVIWRWGSLSREEMQKNEGSHFILLIVNSDYCRHMKLRCLGFNDNHLRCSFVTCKTCNIINMMFECIDWFILLYVRSIAKQEIDLYYCMFGRLPHKFFSNYNHSWSLRPERSDFSTLVQNEIDIW